MGLREISKYATYLILLSHFDNDNLFLFHLFIGLYNNVHYF